MFRTKVAATLLTIFAVVGGVLYLQAADHAEAQAREAMAERLDQARRALEKVRQLEDFALVAKAEELARWTPMARILNTRPQDLVSEDGTLPTDERFQLLIHNQMHTEVHVWSRKFDERAKAGPTEGNAVLSRYRHEKPDLFMVVDPAGVGVAQAGDPAWYGTKEANVSAEYPILSRIAEGRTFKDLWQWKGAPMDVAVAPIRFNGKVVGAVVLGYRLTGAEARKDKEVVDAEVAYFVGDQLRRGSSLDTDAERTVAEKVVQGMDLKSKLDQGPQLLDFELNGQTWQAMAGRLGSNAGAEKAGFLVMADLTSTIYEATSYAMIIPLVILVAALVALALVMFFHRQFVQPLEQIDNGVLEIINGNLDYWFEVDGDSKALPDTMGQNLNIMVCHLSGRPLPEDDEEPPKPVKRLQWQEGGGDADPKAQSFEGPLSAERSPASGFAASVFDPSTPLPLAEQSGLSAEILSLVNEPEEDYLRRVYAEYVNASEEAGSPVKGITFQKFTDQLANHANDLKQRYNCTRIRFLVNVNEARVSLKPVPIA